MQAGLRQAIFFIVVLAVPVASYFLVFRPQNTEIARARNEIEHKHAMLDKLREVTSQTDDLQRANEEIRQSIEAIEARLPSSKEMDEVLRQVSLLAQRNGLQVPKFKKKDKAMPAGLAFEQTLDVEITGDFDGFYQFLLELERMPRITRIPDMKIERNTNVDGEMKANFVLSVYYQGDGSVTP